MLRAQNVRPQVTETELFPAPTRGWIQSGNIVTAPRDAAEVLDNFIPTSQGVRLRGGATEYADLGASVVRLFTYASGGVEDFFGSTESKVFDLDRVNGGSNAFAELEGLSSGDWSVVQTSTTGGQFLVAVNGSDHAVYWDGSEFNPIVDAAVNELSFDAETAAFTVGETVTGGTSGASAEILAIVKTSATAGKLKLGVVTSGPFQDNETITDSATGSATADGANSSASSVTITNVDTDLLSQVWLFKERLFFVEKNTTSVWYLPVDSIGGAASEIDLGSVFRRGGSVLFGATWSLDSGAGIDDVCLFVSDQGEVAVYEGTDPSSASTWSLVGVYDIGRPLDKHAYFKAGGDLAILTEDGIIPVSEALRKDRSALQAAAITYPIEDAWRAVIAQRSVSYPISATLWQDESLLLVGTPASDVGKPVAFAANARTGAWCRITGWDVRCSAVSGGGIYYGDATGKVYEADTGGTDNGTAYSAICVPKFSTANIYRSVNNVGLTYRGNAEANFDLDAHADYKVDDISPPLPTEVDASATWGTMEWGTFVWGSGVAERAYSVNQAAYVTGYALAPSVAVTVNSTAALDFEILAMRMRFEKGYAL